MKIWIVSEFYESPNDTVGGYYVKGLAEKLAVTEKTEVVIPGRKSDPASENTNNITVSYIHQFRFNRRNLVIRTIAQLIMSFQFFFFLYPRINRNDLIISFTHPPFMIFISSFLKNLKHTKTIIINYDLFPDILIGTGASKRNFIYKTVLRKFDKAYNNADTIISLGKDMTRLLEGKVRNVNTKIHTIPNWADVENIYYQPKEENAIITKYGLESRIVLSYAGTIGRCQGLDRLLNLIGSINYNDKIHFLFFGKGIAVDSFQKQILLNRNRKMITYAGFIVTSDRKIIINACDIAIVSLPDSMIGINFPSKTYNILASGHPILFVGKEDFELAEFITFYDIGWICSSSDSMKFQDLLIEILNNPAEIKKKGEKARMVAEKYFSKEEILNQYMDAIVLQNRGDTNN